MFLRFTAVPSGRPVLAFLFVTLLLDALALGMVRPVLPGLIRALSGGDAALGARMFGLAETGWALTQLLFAPLMGMLADRFGRRPLILASTLALGLDYALMAITSDLNVLLAGRALSGVAAGAFFVAGACIADLCHPEERAAGFGVFGAAIGIGFGLGPVLGGFLGGEDPCLPFWAATILVVANVGWTLFAVPETLARDRRRAVSWRRAHPLGALRFLHATPNLFRLSVVALLAFVAFEVMPTTFVLYAQHRFDWPPGMIGLALGGVGIGLGVVQAGLVPPVVARIGESRTVLAGLAAGVIGLAALVLVSAAEWLWSCVPMIALWGLFVPSVQSAMTRLTAETEQGRLQGAIATLHTLAKLIAPALFTTVFASAIAVELPAEFAALPFLLAAALAAVALVLAWDGFRTAERRRVVDEA